MKVVAQFAAPVEKVWAAYADPRQLERFWGPPQWPATFERHDFKVGGRSEYYMTGPNGEKSRGFWEFQSVEPPRSFDVKDGFLGPDGMINFAITTVYIIISTLSVILNSIMSCCKFKMISLALSFSVSDTIFFS